MGHKIEVWDYKDNEEQLKKFFDYVKENKKLVVIYDEENDKDSYILVGSDENRDVKQAELILDFMNNDEEYQKTLK